MELAAHRNRQAGDQHGGNLRAAIAGQHHRHVVALRYEHFGQRLDDVCQAASLGERQPFRCHEENSHSVVIMGLSPGIRCDTFTLSNPWERVKHGALYPFRPRNWLFFEPPPNTTFLRSRCFTCL